MGRAVATGLALFLGACAVANTAQQELAYAADAARAGPPLPEPIAFGLGGGP